MGRAHRVAKRIDQPLWKILSRENGAALDQRPSLDDGESNYGSRYIASWGTAWTAIRSRCVFLPMMNAAAPTWVAEELH
jgi:hypothetical protein